MRFALKFCAALIVGTFLGLVATWAAVMWMPLPGAVANGPWQTSLAAGSAQADPWTRAAIAVHALFALPRSETIYFRATRDSAGNRLNGTCRYRIHGRDPDARWWSITAYGADDFLIANPAHRYSVSQTEATRAKDGAFTIDAGGARPPSAPSAWIPAGDSRFWLALRLYNPGPEMALDPANAALPAIDTVWCP
jgi:hypothetical protein